MGRKYYKFSFLISLILVIIFYLLPAMFKLPYKASPMVGLIIAPILGAFGAYMAYEDKAYVWMVLNLIVASSYYLITKISYLMFYGV